MLAHDGGGTQDAKICRDGLKSLGRNVGGMEGVGEGCRALP